MGWVVIATAMKLHPWVGGPVPIVQEAECVSRPVWMGPENPACMGFEPRTDQPVANRYTDYAFLVANFVYDPSRTLYTPVIH